MTLTKEHFDKKIDSFRNEFENHERWEEGVFQSIQMGLVRQGERMGEIERTVLVLKIFLALATIGTVYSLYLHYLNIEWIL